MGSILLATAKGYYIRFPECDEIASGGAVTGGVRAMGRSAKGLIGMKLRKGDRLVSMEILKPEGDILTVLTNGTGRRTDLSEFKSQGRGGMGVTNIKVDSTSGPVVSVLQVSDFDSVMVITSSGKIIRLPVAGIRRMTKKAKGIKLLDIEDGDQLVSAALAEAGESFPVCPQCFREAKPAVTAFSPRAVFWKCSCGFMDTDGQEFPDPPETGWPSDITKLTGWEILGADDSG